jgi:hypothetical protein
VLVFASDTVAAKVQEALSVTCSVTLATSTGDAMAKIRTEPRRKVVVDSNSILDIGHQLMLQAVRDRNLEILYLVLLEKAREDLTLWRELNDLPFRVRVYDLQNLDELARTLITDR